ncbi:MAG TPA: hypothetical protein VKB67_09015 [Rhizomicrobium sp.]|nr:hypothetical protein [Rhizomicrobium sp.]
MKRICAAVVFVPLFVSVPGWAQTMPPTTQQLQQQANQAIQNETNAAHNNLNQTQQQIQQQAQQPSLTPSGRAVEHPPGYIPMPH